MNDAPMGAEMPVSPKLENLAKSPAAGPTAPEAPLTTPEKPATPADARTALEQIAAGSMEEATRATPASPATPGVQKTQVEQATPVTPATPVGAEGKTELGPDKEKVDAILTTGTQLLLDAGDKRAVLTALARHVAPTPLGLELRRDVIASIAEMRPDKLTSDQAATLTSLQHDIASLNMPKTDPARSEFAKFLEEYSQQNPDKAVPAHSIEAIRTNKLDRAQQMANVVQRDSTLSAKLNEQFKGDRTEPLANVATPDGLLKAAGLPATPENTAKATKIFEAPPPPDPRSLRHMSDYVMHTFMGVALISMFMNQFISSGEGQGGGH